MVSTFEQQIRFVGSMIISDDTGQLMRLIQALAILVGMLVTLLRVIGPLLVQVQETAEAWQFAWVVMGIRVSSLAWGVGLTQ